MRMWGRTVSSVRWASGLAWTAAKTVAATELRAQVTVLARTRRPRTLVRRVACRLPFGPVDGCYPQQQRFFGAQHVGVCSQGEFAGGVGAPVGVGLQPGA